MSTYYRTVAVNCAFCLVILLVSYANGQTNKSSRAPVTGRTPRSRPPIGRYSTNSTRPPAVDRRPTSLGSSSTLKTDPATSTTPWRRNQDNTPSTKPTVSVQTPIATATTHSLEQWPLRPAEVRAIGENNNQEILINPEAVGGDVSNVRTTSTRWPSTGNQLANVVTAPMPLVPLQTVFVATGGGEDESGCIAIKTGIRFTFSYVNVSSGKIEHGKFDLPIHNHTIEGDCGLERQRMSLIFSPDHHVTPALAIESGIAWNLTMSFVRNESSDVFLDQLSLSFVMLTGHLPFPWSVDAKMRAFLQQKEMFHTPDEEHSFICMSDAGYGNFVSVTDDKDDVSLGIPTSAAMVTQESSSNGTPVISNGDADPTLSPNKAVQLDLIEFYNLQLQAFLKPDPTGSGNNVKSVSFSKQVIQCNGDFISVRIPVIVGIILLVFVVSVLIIYTVRRVKRSKQTNRKGRSMIDYRPVD